MSEKMFNSYDDKSSPGADDLFLLWDNQESKVKNLKINNLSKYVENKFPKKLPNPHKLTFNGAVSAEYDGSGAVTVTIPEVSVRVGYSIYVGLPSRENRCGFVHDTGTIIGNV